ncbi:MAG: hypothetical protein ABIH65_03110, partial [Nanoarchaeota archaeon]
VTNTSYYLLSNPYAYYNSTTIGNLPNTNNYWNNTFATFNKTFADTLYFGIGNWNATNASYALNQTLTDMWTNFLTTTNTSYLMVDKWNATNTSYRTLTNGTFTQNISFYGTQNITSNTTCISIWGPTSRLEIC